MPPHECTSLRVDRYAGERTEFHLTSAATFVSSAKAWSPAGEPLALVARGESGAHSRCSERAFGIENSFYVDAEGLYRPARLGQSGHRIDDQAQLGCWDFTHPGGEFQIVFGRFRSGAV